MVKGALKIHSQNILPIIKKWLYSEKEIFIRELVSNACDALLKVKILQEKGQCLEDGEELRIDIHLDDKTIVISDTGLGMTAEEVEKYIAQIAFSGAEEFVALYEKDKDQIIGHFGLGFYSSYMVADLVDIDTLSYKVGSEGAFWSCDGSTEYDMETSSRKARGTSITLHVGTEHKEMLDKAHFKKLLLQYCQFMPFPIYLEGECINKKEPLWIKSALDCQSEEYKDFFKTLYPNDLEPLFWVHLNVDYPFNLKGILYFPRLTAGHNFKDKQIYLFCNRVFVSDGAAELLPEYLSILKGALDSPDLPLNVSRSMLQTDKTVRQLGAHISRKVVERLVVFYEQEKEGYLEAWPHIEIIIKLGVLQDEKFAEKAESLLVWKTSKGSWVSLKEYQERFGDKIFYASDSHVSSELLELFHAKGKEILLSESAIDGSLFSYLENKASLHFQRLDGALDEMLLDNDREKTLLDDKGQTFGARLGLFAKEKLGRSDLQIEVKSLASDSLPGFVLINEQERRMRDYMALHQAEKAHHFKPQKTLVLNTNSPLIQSLDSLDSKDPLLAKEILEQVFYLSLLSQKELQGEEVGVFVKQQSMLLEKLTSRL